MLVSDAPMTSPYPPATLFPVVDTLADRLRWVMNHKGWSASRLSQAAGKARGHVGLILSGRVGAGVAADTLAAIAAAAGVSLEWLQSGVGDPLAGATAGERYDAHPEWASAVAEAPRKYPGFVPPFAYEYAGRMIRSSRAAHITPEIALQLARVWIDTASEDERAAATAAYARALATQAARTAMGDG